MNKFKSFTSIEQSKKLAEILPLESADCFWDYDEMQKFHRISWFEDGFNKESQLRLNENNVCAWSLAALYSVMPTFTIDSSDDNYFRMHCCKMFTEWHDNPIDCCVEMILKLHEQKIL